MRKLATDKLWRYDTSTVQNCLQEVKGDPKVKAYVRSVLMDDPTCSYLQVADNERQVNLCFIDFFSRNLQYLLRLANLSGVHQDK